MSKAHKDDPAAKPDPKDQDQIDTMLADKLDSLQGQIDGLLKLIRLTSGMHPENEAVQQILAEHFPDKTIEEVCGGGDRFVEPPKSGS